MERVFYEAAKDTSGKVFAERQHEYASRLHFHRAFELAYITQGSARYEIGGKEFVAEQDDIVFCHCYYKHRTFRDLPQKKIVIAVPRAMFPDVSALFAESTMPVCLRDKAFNKTLLPYFTALLQGGGLSALLQRGYVSLIFGSLAARYDAERVAPENKDVSLIVEVLDYLDRHFTEPVTLEGIAARFGYNRSYFSRMFNACVGVSLNVYLNALRLGRYEALSKECAEKSVTERVLEAGFGSLATFYRVRGERRSL